MCNAHVRCYLLSRVRLFMFTAFTCGQRFAICLLALWYLDPDTDLSERRDGFSSVSRTARAKRGNKIACAL